MEKLMCTGCGAPLAPNDTDRFLTCAYCETAVPNPYYDESAAAQAQQPQEADLDALCVQRLVEMGKEQSLAENGVRFGAPLSSSDAQSARAAMGIPDADKVYLVYDATSLIGGLLDTILGSSFAQGFALCTSGLYYKLDGEQGQLSWLKFITGAISCTLGLESRLNIGSLSFPVDGNADQQLASFVIDFHNQIYYEKTGSFAPAEWAVKQQTVQTVQSAPAINPLAAMATAMVGSALLGNHSKPRPRPTAHAHTRPVHTVKPLHPYQHAQRPQKPSAARPQRPQGFAGKPQRPQMGRPVQPVQGARPQTSRPRPGAKPGPAGRDGRGGRHF